MRRIVRVTTVLALASAFTAAAPKLRGEMGAVTRTAPATPCTDSRMRGAPIKLKRITTNADPSAH